MAAVGRPAATGPSGETSLGGRFRIWLRGCRKAALGRRIAVRATRSWLITAVAAAATYSIVYPTYEYRYRLTISIEIDGQFHSRSSVVDIAWVGQPDLVDAGPLKSHIRGQATFVNLGSQGTIGATVNNGESYGLGWSS
jgi:hypothetical protein